MCKGARGWAGLLLLVASLAYAIDRPLNFGDPAQQARYEALLHELRCLVCQNQTLADSEADLAQDLRGEVYRMVSAQMDDPAIIAFMVKRYGDFVLYRPPVQRTTVSLWYAPAFLLVIMVLVWRRVQQASALALQTPLTAQEQARLASIMASGTAASKTPEA